MTDTIDENWTQSFSMIQPTTKQVEIKDIAPRLRFQQKGPNANAPATKRMREIKDLLHLTTRQLVTALNAYEQAHQRKNFKNDSQLAEGEIPWLPMNPILLSSYLQGNVQQDVYMELMLLRLENYFAFASKNKGVPQEGQKDIRSLMNEWFEAFEITSADKFRPLAKFLAPYLRRTILAKAFGVIHFGDKEDNLQHFKITAQGEDVAHGCVDLINPVLVKNGQEVKLGDEIQCGLQFQTVKDPETKQPMMKDGKIVYLSNPIEDHTVFYRWYKTGNGPRSIQTLELVQEAVKKALAAKN